MTLRGRLTLPVVEPRPMVDCPVPSDGADEWLEPDAGRLARPVLRGRWRSNALLLPDIGVDSQTGLTHSAVVTAANVHDKHALPDLLHGDEQRVYGDSAYASQKELMASKAPKAKDFTNDRVKNRLGEVDELKRAKNHNKSKIRARVEHVFAVVKRLWGFGKVRYRGLAKNANRAFAALALANLYMSRSRLMGQLRPKV